MNADHARRVSQPGVGDFDEKWNLKKWAARLGKLPL
jgi:hypothetical protein